MYNPQNNTQARKNADGFANVAINLPTGVSMKLRKGVPLALDNKLERSLINAAKADPDFKVQATITVHVIVDDTGEEDIAFGVVPAEPVES